MRELEQDIAAAVAQAVAAPAGPSLAEQPAPPALRSRKRLAWYLAVSTCAVVALLGAGFVATSLLSESGARTEARASGKGEIRIGRVDLPDLKDGVPQISPSGSPVRSVAIGGPSTTASIAAPAPSRSSLLAAAPIGPAAAAGISQAVAAAPAAPASAEPSIRSLAAAPPAPLPVIRTTTAAVPAQTPVKVASVAAAAPAPVVASLAVVPVPPARATAPRATASLEASATPLPPVAPTRTASVPPVTVRAKPAIVATVARPKPVTLAGASPVDPTTTAAITSAKPVREEEHYDVFGMKVPTLGTTANRIRDGVGAIGDAVTSLPERF